jgi:membrane protease YdiL (CAAX protease family)
VSFAAWFMASVACAAVIAAMRIPAGSTRPAGDAESLLTDTDLALLSVIGPLAAFVIAVCVVPLFQRGTLRWIGFGWADLGKGAKLGVLAFLVVLPCMFVVEMGVGYLYRAINYKHPEMHDLLRVMKEGDQTVKWLAIWGAVLVAPVFEELLFRGLLQTAITEWLTRLSRPRLQIETAAMYGSPGMTWPRVPGASGEMPSPLDWQTGVALPQVGPGPAGPPHVLPPVVPPDVSVPQDSPLAAVPAGFAIAPEATADASSSMSATPSPNRHRAAWIAIMVTAGLFAIVHPLWTAPIIFVLAVALGYIYERTGNLWASITVHAMFNTTSTLFVLLGWV